MWKFPIILTLLNLINPIITLNCYECTSELMWGEYDACYNGDKILLRPVVCAEPSVCVTYHYYTQTLFGYRMSVSRGCQAVRFGATCDDIFLQLQQRGAILPGQHTCTTCNTDYCNHQPNFSGKLLLIFPLIIQNCAIFL